MAEEKRFDVGSVDELSRPPLGTVRAGTTSVRIWARERRRRGKGW
jgi:hypothetical protein